MRFPWGGDGSAFAHGCNSVVDYAVVDQGGRFATMAGRLVLGRHLSDALWGYHVVVRPFKETRICKGLWAGVEVACNEVRERTLAEEFSDLPHGDSVVTELIGPQVNGNDHKLYQFASDRSWRPVEPLLVILAVFPDSLVHVAFARNGCSSHAMSVEQVPACSCRGPGADDS